MRYCDNVDEDGFLCGEMLPPGRSHHWCTECCSKYMVKYRKKNGRDVKQPGRKGPIIKYDPK